jgi:S1-C subfamily serine protease
VGLPDRVIGSGFFIDKRGYLITNYHVIASEVDPKYEGFSRLYIRLPEKPEQRVPAKVIGYDRIFDIALLKVEIDVPYVFSFNETRDLSSGLPIYAIGSPIGLDKTITSGIISATERRFLQMGDAMQIDVPVNPGSSGGPLLNEKGALIGIVFAGLLQFESINFAIPAFWIRKFLPSFYRGGEVSHPWLGAAVYKRDTGLEIQYVPPGSPADKAGLRAEDILTEIGGVPVETIAAAQDILLSRFPESLVTVTWIRDGGSMDALINLEERPFSPVEEALDKDLKHRLFPVLFGMRVKKSGSTFFQEDYVITDIYPGSPADETGLSADDPFTLRNWVVDEDQRAALLQIFIRKRKAGFLEAGIQLASYLELDNFI